MEGLYALGLSWMARPPIVGFRSLGAILVRALRELDPNRQRQYRMWLAAVACLPSGEEP